MTQTLESLFFFYQFACACSHATMTTTICPKTMQDFEHSKETVECEGNKSECELEIKIVAMEKAKEDRTVVLAAPPPVTGQAAVSTTDGKESNHQSG